MVVEGSGVRLGLGSRWQGRQSVAQGRSDAVCAVPCLPREVAGIRTGIAAVRLAFWRYS